MNALPSTLRRKRPFAFLGATFVVALVAIGSTLGIASAEEKGADDAVNAASTTKTSKKEAGGKVNAFSTPKGNQSAACTGYKAFSQYAFYINGKILPAYWDKRDILNKPRQGDTIWFDFKLKPECDNMYVGLDAYTGTSATFNPTTQKLYQRDDDLFRYNKGANNRLAVTLPNCYFQVDAYNQATFTPGDFTGGGGDGFLTGDVGGTKSCTEPTKAPAPKPVVKPVVEAPAPKPVEAPAPKPVVVEAPAPKPVVEPVVVKPVVVNKPSATVEKVCSVDGSGVEVTLTNDGNVEETFTVRNGTTTTDTVKVPAGKDVTRTYKFDDLGVGDGESTTLTVVAGTKSIASLTATNDCVAPAADVTTSCPVADGNPQLTFTNSGEVPVTFTVTRDGKTVAFEDGENTLEVAPNSAVNQQMMLAEDETATLTIAANPGDYSVTKTVTKDCVEVQGVVIESPTTVAPEVLGVTLANTGIGVVPMSALGFLLLGLGAAALGGRKRLS